MSTHTHISDTLYIQPVKKKLFKKDSNFGYYIYTYIHRKNLVTRDSHKKMTDLAEILDRQIDRLLPRNKDVGKENGDSSTNACDALSEKGTFRSRSHTLNATNETSS